MIKEFRYLDCEDLAGVCMENDFYTCGSRREYSDMFYILINATNNGKKSLTTETIEALARDIKAHSITDCEVIDIMYYINKACSVYYREEK